MRWYSYLPPIINTGKATWRVESHLDMAKVLRWLLQVCEDFDSPWCCRLQNHEHSGLQLCKWNVLSWLFVMNSPTYFQYYTLVNVATFPFALSWPPYVFPIAFSIVSGLIKLTIHSFLHAHSTAWMVYRQQRIIVRQLYRSWYLRDKYSGSLSLHHTAQPLWSGSTWRQQTVGEVHQSYGQRLPQSQSTCSLRWRCSRSGEEYKVVYVENKWCTR